jgi:hypothetical protein
MVGWWPCFASSCARVNRSWLQGSKGDKDIQRISCGRKCLWRALHPTRLRHSPPKVSDLALYFGRACDEHRFDPKNYRNPETGSLTGAHRAA